VCGSWPGAHRVFRQLRSSAVLHVQYCSLTCGPEQYCICSTAEDLHPYFGTLEGPWINDCRTEKLVVDWCVFLRALLTELKQLLLLGNMILPQFQNTMHNHP
jgi:hypothetical protein